MTIFASGKGVSVTREFLQRTKETPIKPSFLIVKNAKDNEIIDLIYDHASLIPVALHIGKYTPLQKHNLSCNSENL